MKKYIVHEGYVISKIDGDRHFINAQQLMQLHKVSPSECIIVRDGEPDFGANTNESYIHLFPRYDGNYKAIGGGE